MEENEMTPVKGFLCTIVLPFLVLSTFFISGLYLIFNSSNLFFTVIGYAVTIITSGALLIGGLFISTLVVFLVRFHWRIKRKEEGELFDSASRS